jgi:mono/diheme cytochrome c family protein
MKRSVFLGCGALLMLSLGACEKQATGNTGGAPAVEPAQSQAATPAAAVDPKLQAQEIFSTRCTPCHGPKGAGDGPASAGLTPKPRNFQDAAWQSSVTDDHLEKVIAYGGAAVGKSPAMPPNPDLADKPIIPALREHIRTLKP